MAEKANPKEAPEGAKASAGKKYGLTDFLSDIGISAAVAGLFEAIKTSSDLGEHLKPEKSEDRFQFYVEALGLAWFNRYLKEDHAELWAIYDAAQHGMTNKDRVEFAEIVFKSATVNAAVMKSGDTDPATIDLEVKPKEDPSQQQGRKGQQKKPEAKKQIMPYLKHKDNHKDMIDEVAYIIKEALDGQKAEEADVKVTARKVIDRFADANFISHRMADRLARKIKSGDFKKFPEWAKTQANSLLEGLDGLGKDLEDFTERGANWAEDLLARSRSRRADAKKAREEAKKTS